MLKALPKKPFLTPPLAFLPSTAWHVTPAKTLHVDSVRWGTNETDRECAVNPIPQMGD